jgi:FkbM family methyltransferase
MAAFTGEYAESAVELLKPFMDPGSDILDIGASLGFFTIPLGLAAGATAASRVIAYEPIPGNLTYLHKNIRYNRLYDRVSVRPVALGRYAGTAEAHVEGIGAGNAVITSGVDPVELRRHDSAGHLGSTALVEVVSLDDEFADSSTSCSLAKIDVEGFEMDVLAGGERFLARCRPVILGEFNPQWLRSRGISLTAPYEWCKAHDYDVLSLADERRSFWTEARPHPRPSQPGSPRGDLLLIPRERASLMVSR